jgi:hypothetical protein
MLGFITHPEPSYAAEQNQEYMASSRLPANEAKPQIKSVLQQDEFSQVRKVKHWISTKSHNDEDDDEDYSQPVGDSTSVILAELARMILWIAVIIGIVLAIVYRKKWLSLLRKSPPKAKPVAPPDVVLGLDIRPESLPEDIASASRHLWERGQHREALSLLYRGALMQLTRHEQFVIKDSDTEGDILRLARHKLTGQRIAWLAAVTYAWQEIAYAHRLPLEQQVQPLFADWNRFIQPTELAA